MNGLAKINESDWDSLIEEVCRSIGEITGNVLSDKQRPMVESRMKRRLMDLQLKTPVEYRVYWKTNREEENKKLIGLLTTHFTAFFREFGHFEWLASALPGIVDNAKKESRTSIKIWSSACSKGQEVWSLCMWLNHHMPRLAPTMNWIVYGSDIDPESVKTAENGVYHRRELETVPREFLEGNWIKGKGDIADWYKVKSDFRTHTKFLCLNLLDIKMPPNEVFDVIFCRNVLIYFDRPNQEKVAKGLLKFLTPQGSLITGVSESLTGYGLPVKSIAPSIYKQASAEIIPLPQRVLSTGIESIVVPKPLRVLCVDDSSTVLSILKKILREPEFQIVGTAANGLEAKEKFASLKPDVVTLDIHMPVMDGPTFLKESGIAQNTPVIVMSSMERGDSMVDHLFGLGVCDFVEKPTLNNLDKVGEEISQKLKMGWLAKKKKTGGEVSTPKTLPVKKRPNGHIVINCGQTDLGNVLHVIKTQKWEKDDFTIFFNGTSAQSYNLKESLSLHLKNASKVNMLTSGGAFPFSGYPAIWLHFKEGSKETLKSLVKPNHFVVMEENGEVKELKDLADDLSPATSFSYLIDKLLNGL